MNKFSYELSLEDTILKLNGIIKRWFASARTSPPFIEDFPEPVYFKSSAAVLVHSNEAYRKFFARGMSTTGRLASSFLNNSIIGISEKTDALILSGVHSLQFEHDYLCADNNWYCVRSYKVGLLEYGDGAYEILGVSRPIAVDENTNAKRTINKPINVWLQKKKSFAVLLQKEGPQKRSPSSWK